MSDLERLGRHYGEVRKLEPVTARTYSDWLRVAYLAELRRLELTREMYRAYR